MCVKAVVIGREFLQKAVIIVQVEEVVRKSLPRKE